MISDLNEATRAHHGVVLDVSPHGFDRAAASFGSVFVDEDNPSRLFLFYTGACDVNWSRAAIGMATSTNGSDFTKLHENPILEGTAESFCHNKALAPVVTRIRNRFYMIFSGSSASKPSRRIGIAYADELKGPWHIIGELIKPTSLWEGNAIDNGPALVKLDEETILVYYSSVTSPKTFDVFSLLRGYPVRRIGILKVRIRGASHSSIEAMRFSGNPLKHLNGPKGSWNESLFCPGLIELNGINNLFPSGSIYSEGTPYKQYIGVAANDTPFFQRSTTSISKLIDGPSEKSFIMPGIKSEIALDTAAPYLHIHEQKLFLYYSVADRADEKWKIALTTFKLTTQRLKSKCD